MLIATHPTIAGRIVAVDAQPGINYRCPGCGDPVLLVRGTSKADHFRHFVGAECAHGEGESEEHQRAKLLVFDACRRAGEPIELERRFDEIKRRSDIFLPRRRAVIEIQVSGITEEEVAAREFDYGSLGHVVRWVIVDGGQRPRGILRLASTLLADRVWRLNLQTGALRRVAVTTESYVSGVTDHGWKPVTGDARAALEIRAEASKASTAKVPAMLAMVGPDDRLRGLYQHHGAGTGRPAGRGPQPTNLPRGTQGLKHEAIAAILDMLRESPDYRAVLSALTGGGKRRALDTLSDSLRSMFVAKPGHELVVADYASIEGRMLAWFADEEWVLDIYRTHGRMYEATASTIYHVDPATITKEDPRRQIGKVAELALGYQGWVGAFQSMAANYNVKVSDEEAAEIAGAWRKARPMTRRYWKACEAAAIEAMRCPGTAVAVGPFGQGGRVRFAKIGRHLWLEFPSGRRRCYPDALLEDGVNPYGEPILKVSYMAVDSRTRKWMRTDGYGGLWTENVVQGAAADLQERAMARCERRGWPVVLQTYDEIGLETLRSVVSPEALCALMTELPDWAAGLPIAAAGWAGTRYRK